MAAVSKATRVAPARPMWRRAWIWLVVPVAAALGLALLMVPRSATPAIALSGTTLRGKLAPDFRLKDQFGRPIRMAALRGHPVVLTFLSASCTQLCPVAAESIRRTLSEVGGPGRRVDVLAVGTGPEADTPAVVKKFSRQHGLYQRWHYLTGSRLQLSKVWASYYIYAAPASASQSARDAHTSATYLIDGQGRERVLIGGNPQIGWLVRDLRIFLGRSPDSAVPLVAAPQPGHPAPAFSLPSLNSGRVHLSQYRGRTLLINFWASWCKPCRSEMPMLSSWYRKLHSHGLVILGVNQNDSTSSARAFSSRLKIPYPIAVDSDGQVPALYSVGGLPTSVLVDRYGVVRWVKAQVLSPSDLKRSIQPVISS